MLNKSNAKELNEQQKNLALELCKSIVLGKEKSTWKRTATSCIKNFDKIEEISIIPKIVEISEKHKLETYPSALLYHTKNFSK